MELHVASQVALVLEGPHTYGAHESGRVAPGVSVQCTLSGEHGRADRAPERLGSVLLLHVLHERHLEAKPTAAQIARERLFACVPAHVRRHVRLAVEATATVRTSKRALPRMRPLVPFVSNTGSGHERTVDAREQTSLATG